MLNSLRLSQSRSLCAPTSRFFSSKTLKSTIADDALGVVPVVVKKKEFFNAVKAIQECRLRSQDRKFDESIDISLKLGVDPRKPNQSVRGVVKLPHGTGKKTSIAVFARGDKAEEAKAAGATVVGAEDLVKEVMDGNINFDRCLATPDVMPLIGRIARILGPRGLMPNPKLGTVTMNISQAVEDALGGQAEFRAQKQGVVNAAIGKKSFTDEQILDNLRAFMVAIGDSKPSGAKGKYLLKATMSTTMGKSVDLDLQNVDPSSMKFMRFN